MSFLNILYTQLFPSGRLLMGDVFYVSCLLFLQSQAFLFHQCLFSVKTNKTSVLFHPHHFLRYEISLHECPVSAFGASPFFVFTLVWLYQPLVYCGNQDFYGNEKFFPPKNVFLITTPLKVTSDLPLLDFICT